MSSHTSKLCVLLACFEGASGVSKVRGSLDTSVRQHATILDEVVLRVDSRHRAGVHDPRRTLAGVLAATISWGILGLVSGGWSGLGLWAVLGAVCGGGYAYLAEHLLTKDELARIGQQLPADSSAITVFAQSDDPQQLVAGATALGAATASVVSIDHNLVATRYPADGAGPDADSGLTMILARFPGERTLPKKTDGPRVELLIMTSADGRRRVADPTSGARTTARGDIVSWGGFGLVWGAVAGYLDNGLGGLVDQGLLTGIGWAVFGMVAGALYGMWAGRAVSARRLKRLGPIAPPNSTCVLAWTEDTMSARDLSAWATGNSGLLTVHFAAEGAGAVLSVAGEGRAS